MSWDPFQRAVLAELGHVLYSPVNAAAPAISAAPPVAALDPALLDRLARAAGSTPDILLAAFEDPAVLAVAGDARAKRALWPRLRAFRRPRA